MAEPESKSGWERRWRSRRWRLALYAVVALILTASYRYQVLPAAIDGLFDYFLFLSVATTFTPLPTVPAILLAVTQVPAGLLGAVLVGLIGAAGTTVAYLIEYAVLRRVMHLRGARRLRQSRFYVWLAGLFRRAPFTALSVSALLPIPVDGVRLLAISEGYRTGRYALAAFIGRAPRYTLIALLGQSIDWSALLASLRRLGDGQGVSLLGCELSLSALLILGVVAILLVATVGLLVRRHRRHGRVTVTMLWCILGLSSWLAVAVWTGGPAWATPAVRGASVETAPSPELATWLERFDRAVTHLVDARARFRQQRYSPIFEDLEHSAGELLYRAPGDLVLHYDEPEHQEVFIDTAGIWIYLVQQKQAQRYPFDTAGERDGSLAVLWRPSSELRSRYRLELASEPPAGEAADETGGVWLKLEPAADELAQVVRVVYLHLEPETALSDCIVVERVSGERVRLEIVELAINPALDDERFLFKPPADVEIFRFDR